MPVNINTTKEQKLAQLVDEMQKAGLRVTNITVQADSFYSEGILGEPRRSVMSRRDVRATIEIMALTPEAHELLQLWMVSGPGRYTY